MTDRFGRRSAAVVLGAVIGSIGAAAPALAHAGHSEGNAWSGVLHPFGGLDHVLAMVAVGVLASVLARSVAVVGTFLASMMLGGLLGLAGLTFGIGEMAIAVSVAALGCALVAGRATDPRLAVALVAVAGLAHGHAHGAEAPAASKPIFYVVGFLAATLVLHLGGWALGTVLVRRAGARATVGALVAGAGLGLVAGVI
jgi:urease accessory protein